MDGINKKSKKRITRKASQSRSFSDAPKVTISIDSGISASSGIKHIKKKNNRSIGPSINREPLIQKIKKQKKTGKSFLKVFRAIIASSWFIYLAKAIVVFGILIFIFNSQNSTSVKLRPHLEYISLEESITTYRTPDDGDLGFEIIAVTDEASIPIIAAGERPVERYAQGSITLFNDYSSEPQRLLPETRLKSASGKIFKLGTEEVIIPGKVGDEPATLTTIIYADEPGPNYNIDSTDFTIPGFKEAGLDDKYNKIYGFSSTSFEGGFIGTEHYITEEQRILAEAELKEQLRERLLLKISKEKTEELILVDGTVQLDYRASTSVFDDNKETGLITQKGTVLALGVGSTQLNNFLSQNFIETEGTVTMLSANDMSISFNGTPIDFEDQKEVIINISGSPLFSWSINEQSFKDSLRGVHKDDLLLLLESNTHIDKAHIKIKPFWRTRVSDDAERIHLSFQ